MKLFQIGEDKLIKFISQHIKVGPSIYKGIGDDTAVIRYDKKTYLLCTSDMLIEGVHFKKDDPADMVGQKALCCSISDISAMGGLPSWGLISCGLPKDTDVAYAKGLFSGIKRTAKRFNIDIIGGDTNSSDRIILDIHLLGKVEKRNLVLRSSAKVGDFIFVTGELGGAHRGRHLSFRPRLKEARILVNNFKINSMIDISDGLSTDLYRLVSSSCVGAVIYEDLIPVSPLARSVKDALDNGEDYELLFTMSKHEAFKLFSKLSISGFLFQTRTKITRIGTILHKRFGVEILDRFSRHKCLKPAGYAHF